jgi:hypothetical protein
VLLAGFIDGPGPFDGPIKVLAAIPEEARQRVDQSARSRTCCRRNILGAVALSPRAACIQVAIPPVVPGSWLAIAGVAWVILSLTGVLLLQYQDKVYAYAQPAFVGEIAFMLWLVIKSAKPPVLDPAASLSSAG